MLYECAITPDVFDASVVCDQTMRTILVQVLRDIMHKGTMANLCNDGLIKHIKGTRLQALDQTTKRDIMDCLASLNDRNLLVDFPPSGSMPQDDIGWLEETMHYHQDVQFHAIVLGKNLLEKCASMQIHDPAFIEHAAILNSERWHDVRYRTSIQINKSAKDYQTVLTPVLRHASKLRLVDPYLQCNDQDKTYSTFRTIEICAGLMRNASRRRIEIYIANNQKQTRSDWIYSLQPLANNHKLEFTILMCSSQYDRFHDRYILTDQFGIISGDTLACSKYILKDTSTLAILDRNTYSEIIQKLYRLRCKKLCEIRPE